ncbi:MULTISPECIES: bifunctional adenosylcobinamide kinase/adenosylcobinamide-phosphate guanylyltransferase [Halomonadaceae]|uniref:bifunctional adenosylcobinamide kinase/adenosylcobinamide-phosphate guanylyltransferase n=1 Tax=Halomonadaceae TaxID=28256 RepID=UPI001597983B|nr:MULTISPECIES: bifunctional adenosylcobinamide kinase/adenosylcobinamide-phosphate guanylyltransferase [Halomonas]QJQ94902.1 adenosylcobinamide kinase [Halomonas sp. PA5]
MLFFIGGTCAGKRAAVNARVASPCWHSAYDGKMLEEWRGHADGQGCLVLEGWERWIETALHRSSDNDRLRAELCSTLDDLRDWEVEQNAAVVLVMLEMGRGIVPMSPVARRLRDLNGWLAQDAAARSKAVWHVRHGLVKPLI